MVTAPAPHFAVALASRGRARSSITESEKVRTTEEPWNLRNSRWRATRRSARGRVHRGRAPDRSERAPRKSDRSATRAPVASFGHRTESTTCRERENRPPAIDIPTGRDGVAPGSGSGGFPGVLGSGSMGGYPEGAGSGRSVPAKRSSASYLGLVVGACSGVSNAPQDPKREYGPTSVKCIIKAFPVAARHRSR